MAGYRHDVDADDQLAGRILRRALKGTRAYGCLFAILLGGAMSFVIFLGNIMGDCTPGPGCHDRDALHIIEDLAVALPMAALMGAGVWLLASATRAVLQPVLGERVVILLLLALTLALAWFGFQPAMEAFFRWTFPAGS